MQHPRVQLSVLAATNYSAGTVNLSSGVVPACVSLIISQSYTLPGPITRYWSLSPIDHPGIFEAFFFFASFRCVHHYLLTTLHLKIAYPIGTIVHSSSLFLICHSLLLHPFNSTCVHQTEIF